MEKSGCPTISPLKERQKPSSTAEDTTPKPSATDRQKVNSARGVMRPGVSRKKRTNAWSSPR